jgi:hypothetical protein
MQRYLSRGSVSAYCPETEKLKEKNQAQTHFTLQGASRLLLPAFGFVTLCLVSSCKLQNFSESVDQSETKAVSSVTDDLGKFCSSAVSYMGEGFKTEISYLCDGKNKTSLGNIIENAYDGTKDSKQAVYQIKLESSGKTTSFAFLGALTVPKSLKEIERVRKKSMELSLFDPIGITISYTVDKENPPSKPKHEECYDVTERSKDPFGQSTAALEACFYRVGDKILVSYQGPKSGDDNSKANRIIFVRVQEGDNKTLVLAATSKDADNHGLSGMAEGVIKGQAPQIIVQFYDLLKKAPEAQIIPKMVSLDEAKDFNYVNVKEDWSWGRIKLSCNPDTGIYGIKQTNYTTEKPKSIFQIDCGVNMKQEATNNYRYVEASKKMEVKDSINCAENEYVAGVSYHRYSDKHHIIDGIKSILCMEKKTKSKACNWRQDSCADGEYLKGLSLERIGGWICDGKRQDDDGAGCYRVSNVNCCKS